MIPGFVVETQPLSPYEKKQLLPVVVKGLQTRVGKENAITNGEMCNILEDLGYRVSASRLRKIINHIRIFGLIYNLMATSNGYYIATSKDEVEEYVKSLEGRENAINAVRMSLESQMQFL